MTEITPTIEGYQMTENIYDGPRTLIYRAKRGTDQQPVVIKFLKNEYPSFEELVQFRNQYTIAKNLPLDGVVHPLALENYRNGFALIMEEFGGDSLHHYITTNTLTLPEFFKIALAIVKTLEGLYQNRVIHKDIKPQNILINPETQQIKLIDFSIASLLPRETQEIKTPNVLEGTLAYLSPEQTGRMNRGIDYRTDFYSLGVTFYELLTRRLPFQATEPMELVHCHIAKSPKPPMQINAAIPVVVNDLILKLMAKNAEERYQSAFGIRYDLEKCQQQWEDNGQITSFVLGQHDISDRFQISEKLYGRETEIATLLAAFERVSNGNREMMLVAGFSGIGKTVLVNEVHKPIVRQRGYFIKGKFDQFKRDIPFSALVQAFQTLMRQLLAESTAQVQIWKSKILAALGENGQVIIEVIPELEQIIGPQPSVSQLEGSADQNRFNLLLQKFINVFTTAEHPLVIFLDDLQWIDSASLKLIELLMGQTESHYLLLIGAYRDNEVSAAHPLMLTLEEIRKTTALVNQITLGPLAQPDLNRLIADTLSCPPEKATPLTKLVVQKTQGNPFFTNQFLKFLHEEQLISFDFACGYWQCDIAQVKLRAISDDVVEFMAAQLQKLAVNTQNVLKLAACIGNQFDLAILAIVHEKSQTETATDLWKALQEGLIIPVTDVYKFFQAEEEVTEASELKKTLSVPYKFLHDRVQQAAYSLIPEKHKPSTHLKIGQLLKSHVRSEELDNNIFDIVNQLNHGVALLTTQTERDELVQLNLRAGRKARASTAYTAASRYLTVAQELLPTESWQNQYDLTLTVYEAATEAAYLSGDFERQAQLAAIILAQARTILDKIKTYLIQGQVYMAQHQQKEALELMLPVLKQLGLVFPEQPTEKDGGNWLQETQLAWKGKSIESLGDLPMMTDTNQQAIMQILSFLFGPSSEAVPEFFALVVGKHVQFSINYGNVPGSAFGYACYGVLQVGMGDIETGYQFGQLALSILDKFNAKEWKAKVSDPVFGYVQHWKMHYRDSLKPLQEGYQTALEVGDFEYASYCGLQYCSEAYYSGRELSEVEREMANYTAVFHQIKQEHTVVYNELNRQGVLNLMGMVENPCFLVGEAYDEEQSLLIHQEKGDVLALYYLYLHKAIISYLFRDYQQTLENVILVEPSMISYASLGGTPVIYFFEALARLALYPDCSPSEQRSHLDKVRLQQEKMQNWAQHAPMNFQHKFELVEAERLRVLGKHVKAMDFYDRAIAGAKANEFIQDEALANELAARFYLDWGKEQIAQIYLTNAYYSYARWGAKAKVDDLEKCYPQLLAPILNYDIPTFQPDETRRSMVTRTILATSSRHTYGPSSEMLLDFGTVLKASQAIAGEIHLEKLLVTMMQAVLENAGAEKSVLILLKEGKLVIDAHFQGKHSSGNVNEAMILQSIPIEESTLIPISLINYVSRTLETQVIRDASADMSFAADPYIIRHHPKSVLCSPIINQGKLIGLLYLENNIAINAFTSHRLKVLNILSSQAAVSLENALLYQTLEQKVSDRTAQLNTKVEELTQTRNELNAKVEELTQTRHELVQSEKMASLGRLVAGFAHELNTPIGVAVGTASLLQQKVGRINKLLEQEEVDEEDLLAVLEKIDEASNLTLSNLRRAANLVMSFKRTAVDQSSDQVRKFNVKGSIEDVISTLNNKFKQTAIEIQIDCADNLSVYSVPGALEQIITNLIVNSLIHGFDNGKNGGQIKIAVALENQRLHIDYSDTGKGIAPLVLEKVFEPFFTTNRAHGGSGLGMYICYNIVTSQLKGTMTGESTLGKGVTFKMEFPVASSLSG